MTKINLGVKALLSWVNSLKLCDQDLNVNDFQDGTVLLKVVYMLKQEPISSFSNSVEDRFRLVADFLERDCRFNASKGTPLSWSNIKDGINVTVEVAKVLLLLVYQDIMSECCSLKKLDCDMEKEIANLTSSFVMESEGCVFLANGLDGHLARKYLPLGSDVFENSGITSSSNISTVSSFSEENSPIFRHRSKRKEVSFVELQPVASSSFSSSPLQDIMNTPKFQVRKLQRQMMNERDYRDGLERELSSKLSVIAQKETHINQLQHCLDKLKKEQINGEQAIREQITDLENKNKVLQMRLHEILKENKEAKSTSSLLEHKMDELTEENSILSSQVRTVRLQLAIFEAEVRSLTGNQASAEKEWKDKTSRLECNLNQVTTQKELLAEEIEILQGKISSLEDELNSISKEEVGENMGPIMEREIFETEMRNLKNELERAVCSLNEAELCIQAKTQQLVECQDQLTHQKDLLGQQEIWTKRLMEEKEEKLNKLQQELTEKEENMKDLNAKFSALSSLLIVKDKQMTSLREEMDTLEENSKRNQKELQNKDDMLASLTLEKCNEQQLLESQIQLFMVQVENLKLSLKQAEQEIQNKHNLVIETQRVNVQQQQLLQKQIAACEKDVQKLEKERDLKNDQLAILQNDSSCHIVSLEKEFEVLKDQLEILNNHLRKAEEQLQHEKVKLGKQEKESADQIQLLQEQLSTSENEMRAMKEQLVAREHQITTLHKQRFEQSQKFNEEINDLQNQIQFLRFSLTNAEKNMQTKENVFLEQKLWASRDMEVLQAQMGSSRQEVEVLDANISEEEQILLPKTANASHSELVQQEIDSLNKQMQTIGNSLDLTQKEFQTKGDAMAKQERDRFYQKELLQQQLTAAEEVKSLTKDSKEEQMIQLSSTNSTHLDLLHQNILQLDEQIVCLLSPWKDDDNTFKSKENEFEQNLHGTHDMEFHIKKIETSQGEIKRLMAEIGANKKDLTWLKTSTSVNWELLQQEIECLTIWIKSIKGLLGINRKWTRAKEAVLLMQEQEHILQTEELKKHNSVLEDGVTLLKEKLQTKEREIDMIQSEQSKESEMTSAEMQTLTDQIKMLNESVKSAVEQEDKLLLLARVLETSQEESKAKCLTAPVMETSVLAEQMTPLRTPCSKQSVLCQEEDLKSKEHLFFLKEKENTQLREMVQRLQEKLNEVEMQILSQEEQIEEKKEMNERTHLHLKSEESLLFFQSQLSALNIVMKEKDGNIKALKEELAAQAHVVHVLKEEHSKHIQILQQKIQQINEQVETASQKLVAKEQELLQMKRDSAQQLGILQQQLTSAKAEKKAACDLQLATHKDKEILMVRVGQAEKERRALENQLEALILQKDTLIQAKTAEHYKAQMEKAVSHYNKKKQLLQESQEEVTEIKQSLALKESQLQAALTDNKVLQLDLDKAQTNEKELLSLVASLEVQLASADQKLRAQNEIVGQGKSSQRSLSSDGMYKSSLGVHSSLREKRTISSDSLGQSSLEDSLNNARHFSTPDESSTPLIRSSERLAAKCRALGAESLETLYFTPINNRSAKENKREFVSGRESPASLVKRRRTTQVISITMTKNTPETPTSDRLIGLPGYRRSAVYSKSTGTFCVGAENEPDGAPEDWMRIAELQARNKACLPHLKSSYPVEFDTGSCHAFVFTDEELRTGDPADTIRRASMMPSQLQHSLSSHPLSPLMANSANTRSHRLSLMPGAPKTQLRSPKDTKRSSSLAPFLQRSPEKGKAGCFPHPLTPKNKNVLSGPSNALLHPNLPLAERRQSTMFTIDNTPKNSSYLRKGLNKLRSSTRKSPCKGTKTSNAQNRGQENVPTKNTHTAVGRAGRKGKSPQLAPKGQKNSLWATSSKTAKSPRLTASACKECVSIKKEPLFGNL
ncbi:nuclear mitotic apparatus protein 1 isoform X4 [Takifugu rubripes]|uniref:nuclear mitotic apparatus protein 1 isoform X4 n=1 Tax=Takifugu rubripes TaxID=31033 RepID=UPI0011451E17|nr:nuclear mitotic apparatus protein 1 isoform X4 [Takifugu rubripes]